MRMPIRMICSMLFIFFLKFCLGATLCFSQNDILDDMYISETEYSDYHELNEALDFLKQNKLNINKADVSDLCQLPWISENLALSIIEFRKRTGRFSRLSDLKKVDGLDDKLYDLIRDYLSVATSSKSSGFKLRLRSRVSEVLNKNETMKENSYFNSPLKTQFSVKARYGQRLQVGAILEKDSGERKLDDLLVNYVKLNDQNDKNKIIIGNYRLELGQGLAFSGPYSVRKSLSPIKTARMVEKGIVPNMSVDENKSLLGIAGQICFKIYQLIIFYSNFRLDATININNEVESIYESGYHRDAAELAKKDQLREKTSGFAFSIGKDQYYKLSMIYYNVLYNKRIINSKPLINPYAFEGKVNSVFSVNGTFHIKDNIMFGEIARSKNNAYGFLFGLNRYINKKLEMFFIHRNYNQEFISNHANPLSDRSGNPSNEIGYYQGIKYYLHERVALGINYDIFKFPWRTYFEKMPWSGDDLVIMAHYRLLDEFELKLSYKDKNRFKMQTVRNQHGNEVELLKPSNSRTFGLEFVSQLSNFLRLRMRIDKKIISSGPKTRGLLFFQDMSYHSAGKLRLYGRISYYDTEDYDSRVYQFENDIPGVMTSKMLYGLGNHIYVCAIYKITKSIELSLKYSESRPDIRHSSEFGESREQSDKIGSYSVQLDLNL